MRLGSLAGVELGFGSDLELMVVYQDREASGPAVAEFFDQVVRELRTVLGGAGGRHL